MSDCVVGSAGFELPCSIIAEHSVESCDHFSHSSRCSAARRRDGVLVLRAQQPMPAIEYRRDRDGGTPPFHL